MKKILIVLMALILSLGLFSCGSADDYNEKKYEIENNADVDANTVDEEEKEKYQNIIQMIKDKNYDGAISSINQMKDDEAKAENDKKGIREVAITMDNWSEYFEFGYTYDYYTNAFDEITHVNAYCGIGLKEGYELVVDDENCDSSVSFEAGMETYYAYVTYDFAAGTFSIGGPTDNDYKYTKNETATYTDSVYTSFSENDPATGFAGIGYGWQGDVDDGETQEESVSRIVDVVRAEGIIYIYEN